MTAAGGAVTVGSARAQAVAGVAAGAAAGPAAGRPHLFHVFPTFAVGGVQLRMAEVLSHLGGAYRHTILAMDGVFECGSRLGAEVAAEMLAPPPGSAGAGLVARLVRFRRVLRAVRPDLLLTYNWGAVEWALANRLFARCRHLHMESGFGPEEADGQLRRRVWLRRLALARAERIVVPSRTLVEIAVGDWGLAPERVVHIPNGVDCARFARAPVPGAIPGFAKRPGEILVGTIAPLRREKNIARLIRAFAVLAGGIEARLLIVGTGPEAAPLAALVEELGIAEKVVFAGQIAAPETVIGWIDIYALSSDTEQMPNTLLQAMAAGLAVAATDVGDVRRILAGENRPFVVAKEDEGAFAAALARLAAEAPLRAEIGRANRAHVRADFGLEGMVRAYAALFGGRGGAHPHADAAERPPCSPAGPCDAPGQL